MEVSVKSGEGHSYGLRNEEYLRLKVLTGMLDPI
jgi:hypothetical protein